jgi:glutamate 5-kinase
MTFVMKIELIELVLMQKLKYKRVAVKIGSNVLASADGSLNRESDCSYCRSGGNLETCRTEVILISSGAVAAGRATLLSDKKMDTVSARQLWSSPLVK